MAPHSKILAWRIPWKEEPGGLWSIGLQRVDLTERFKNNNKNSTLNIGPSNSACV